MGGIYQQHPYCCAGEIKEYQMKLEYYNPTSIDGEDDASTLTKNYCTNDPNRGTLTHVQTYIHPSLVKARRIGNVHIEHKLSQLYNTVTERQKEAYIVTTNDTPPLQAHLIAHLKRIELLPHKMTYESRPYKRYTYTTRAENTTIRSIQKLEHNIRR